MNFKLVSKFNPLGDQPQAIEKLTLGVKADKQDQVLLGATGTGKTFTIANVIKNTNKTTIILSHNKTLAGQLYTELKTFFPNNKVEYFISNFDYYRPEAYMPSSDTYIDKTSKSNWDIEAMRMSTLNSLSTNEPVIVVASVASIYGQLDPVKYEKTFFEISVGQHIKLKTLFNDLVLRNYSRTNMDIKPGTFRVKGDVVEISSVTDDERFYRVEFFGEEVEGIKLINYLTGEIEKEFKRWTVFPADAYTTDRKTIDQAIKTIEIELEKRLKFFKDNNKLLEAQRLEERTKSDIDSLKEFGVVSGIENYSRHLDGRQEGEKPYTILDYVIRNSAKRNETPLMVIDESHMMIPQLHAMYAGDRSRKENLVEYGFRLPSALDNRPLRFEEYESFNIPKIYISATPAEYEIDKVYGEVVQQIVRPTGLLDPTIDVEPVAGQVEHIYDQIIKQRKTGNKTFIMTTTKRMAEELSMYLQEKNIKAYYLHSEHKTFERDEILRKLRLGVYEVVIGVNLLREGIDIPEVSLVLVLDADKESFFRSTSSLIQIIGRASRNANGRVVLYADKYTKSMKEAIDETRRRRKIQKAYNLKNNITPKTIEKSIPEPLNPEKESAISKLIENRNDPKAKSKIMKNKALIKKEIERYRGRMLKASKELDFERAVQMRDMIIELQAMID